MDRPDIPRCIDDQPHNFMPIGKRHIYCTKCAANVKFTKPEGKRK